MPLSFRPISRDDLPMLRRWLAEPHVRRWWGDPDEGLAEIGATLAEPWTEAFIVRVEDVPVGYIQAYDPHAEPGHPYQFLPAPCRGIDLFIGDPERIGHGLGPALIDSFATGFLNRGIHRLITDPDPSNTVAIRAYQKAGFAALEQRQTDWGPVLLMVRDARETLIHE